MIDEICVTNHVYELACSEYKPAFSPDFDGETHEAGFRENFAAESHLATVHRIYMQLVKAYFRVFW